MLRVTPNASPLCTQCGRILILQLMDDGKTAYTETPADAQCTDRCLIENAGKRFRLPVYELEELR